MDPMAVAGMIFTLVLTVLVGGFIVLFPVTRRLGLLLESKLQEKKDPMHAELAELRQMKELMHSMEAQIRLLAERQEFTEQLITRRAREALPSASEPGE
jgi:cell division protein FtsB